MSPAAVGEVTNLDAAQFVRPRKALKVMSRDIQLAFVAAELACRQAGIAPGQVDPERLGVVFGADMISCELEELAPAYRQCLTNGSFDSSRWGTQAMGEMFPLWMLKYLPNMPACHIGIALDARGPNNSIVLGEVSSLAAIAEAVRVIERGQADAMIAGGTGCRTHPIVWSRRPIYQPCERFRDPAEACRPFDARRAGQVFGEGAGAIVLERREHAAARGARPLARLISFAASFEPKPRHSLITGEAIRSAIRRALADAGLTPQQIGHVNAHGLSTLHDDAVEAQAIRAELGSVPVTALKSFFGNLAAGTGAVELVGSVLAIVHREIPITLNYEIPDPQCPIEVVHGQPAPLHEPTALCLNHAWTGQAHAIILGPAD